MTNNEFVEALIKYQFYDSLNKWASSFLEEYIDDEDVLKLLNIYSVFEADGNAAMPLDDTLKQLWIAKCDGISAQFLEVNKNEDAVLAEIKDTGLNAIDNINKLYGVDIIKQNELYVIENGYLFKAIYYKKIVALRESVNRLFIANTSANTISYQDKLNEGIELTNGQKEIIEKGLVENVIVTGGPGTGKTTSIVFLLVELLLKSTNYEIYLTAPSGKASSRMKESIINNIGLFNKDFVNDHKNVFDIINNLEEYTIHRLLGFDFNNNDFNYCRENKFLDNSIFIIDEASMIDVNIFSSLLDAIPDKARVFIMGDENQLPSVECGAVFKELVSNKNLEENIVRLTESKRFGANTLIYKLANEINNGQELSNVNFSPLSEFEIKGTNKSICPIYYFEDVEDIKEEDRLLSNALNKWGDAYYSRLNNLCSELEINTDFNSIDRIINNARILSSNNEGRRGVVYFNSYFAKKYFNSKFNPYLSDTYRSGMILMQTENNKDLDLYNGDTGVLISFKGDKLLYLMVKKTTKLIRNDGYNRGKLFKLGEFIFYPLHMLDLKKLTLAFAITIHKSQGSDYNNIFVVLPKKKNHPLLNRQIVYTAITRTKGNTYIYSSKNRLDEAKNTKIDRNTRLFF